MYYPSILNKLLRTLLCCLIVGSVYGQTWRPLPMYGGGFITHIVPHPTEANTVVGVCDVGGLFQTVNGGTTWTQLNSTVPKTDFKNWSVRSFAFDPLTPTTSYYLAGDAPYSAGTMGKLWKTTNNGTAWTSFALPCGISGNNAGRYAGATLLIDPTNTARIIVAGQPNFNYGTSNWNSDSGLFISTTNGASFTKVGGTAFDRMWITALRFAPSNPNTVYFSAITNTVNSVATTTGGLWKYDFATSSLTQLQTVDVMDFDFDASGENTIITTATTSNRVTTNGGTTWTALTTPAGLQYGLYATAHPSMAGTWYFGTYSFNNNSIITTSDAGASFYAVKYNGGANLAKINYPSYLATTYKPGFGNYMTGIFFHPANPNTAYLSDWYGVWKTNDASLPLVNAAVASSSTSNANWSWTFQADGIYNMVQVRTSVHPMDTTRFYANVADLHYYESTNSGVSMNYNTTAPMNMTCRIDFHQKNTAIGYMCGTQEHGDIGKLFKTTNGGATWAQIAATTFNGGARNITDLQLTQNADTIIVGVERNTLPSQIYRSDNGGTTWYAWDTGLTVGNVFQTWGKQDKLLRDANGRTFYVWAENKLFRRSLSDAVWTLVTMPGTVSWIAGVKTHPTIPNTLYLSYYTNFIYKSSDNGVTWTATANIGSGTGVFAVSRQGSMAVQSWGASGEHILKLSRDNGATWQSLGTDGFLRMIDGLTFLQDRKLIGWTGGNSGFIADLPPNPTTFFAQSKPLPTTFMGINAWMPDSVGTTYYAGKLLNNTHWSPTKAAKPRLVRIGGIAYDQRFFTNYQIIKLIDSIRAAGAEPLVQVPLWGGNFSAANAAAIVHYLNTTMSRNIRYFSVGNEPNSVYNDTGKGFAANSYTPVQYAAHVKAFSVAMKAIDPSLKIVAGELAWYDATWVNALIGGSADITGRDAATGYDYIDIFSFHTYPFGSTTPTRAQVVSSMAAFEANLADIYTRINPINAKNTRANPLLYAVTEINIDWQNPAGDGLVGVGANSFLGGQWLAHAYTKAAQYGAAFVALWSVAEGGDGQATDIGFLSLNTAAKKPLYHHYDIISKQFRDTIYTTTSNQVGVWAASAKMTDGWAVILSNTASSTDFTFSLRFDKTASTAGNSLKININAAMNKEVQDTLPQRATVVYFYSPKGHLRAKLVYKEGDTQPLFAAYLPTRVKRAFAHYLPWYDVASNPFGMYPRSGWCYEGAACSDTTRKNYTYKPLIGEYSQYDREVLRYHLRLAKAARIDGFIVNLTPTSASQVRIFSRLCEEAVAMNSSCPSCNFRFLVSYDNSSVSSNAAIRHDFAVLRDSFYQNPSFQSLFFKDDITNQPVLLTWSETNRQAYQDELNTVFGNDEILQISRNAVAFDLCDANFEWVGYLNNSRTNTADWGESYFNDFDWIAARQDEGNRITTLRYANALKMGGVYPGFDDRNVPVFWNGGAVRYIAREVSAGETMQLTWQKFRNYTPKRLGGTVGIAAPWVQLITWNDFPEGTQIEPTVALGYKAWQTNRTNIAAWKGAATAANDSLGGEAAFTIYQAAKSGRTTDAATAATLFCSGDYSGAIAAAAVTLPVNWLRFSVQQKQQPNSVLLHWQTAQEQNCKSFTVERSKNGIDFEVLKTVAATGNSNTVSSYYAVDDAPLFDLSYYRIRQTDFDGKSSVSNTLSTLFSLAAEPIQVQPNPVAADKMLRITTNSPLTTLQLFTELGQELGSYELTGNQQELSVSQLPAGVYFFRFSYGDAVCIKRVVVL